MWRCSRYRHYCACVTAPHRNVWCRYSNLGTGTGTLATAFVLSISTSWNTGTARQNKLRSCFTITRAIVGIETQMSHFARHENCTHKTERRRVHERYRGLSSGRWKSPGSSQFFAPRLLPVFRPQAPPSFSSPRLYLLRGKKIKSGKNCMHWKRNACTSWICNEFRHAE